MTLQEAIKSGRRFRRPNRDWESVGGGGRYFNPMEIIVDDYELEPLQKKKKMVWIAVSPKSETRIYKSHETSKAFEAESDIDSGYKYWPRYLLEIECEE